MKRFLWIMLMLWMAPVFGQKSNDAEFALLLIDYVKAHYPKLNIPNFVYVSVKHQHLYFISDTTIVANYPVSTSKYGTGNQLHSEKTPIGLHRVCKKIGDQTPHGGIIDHSGFTGKIAEIILSKESNGKDWLTTRAMRLEGMEYGKNKGGNCDSFVREIYIHGTHEEGLIGFPASHGCIRLRNSDVIELFNQCPNGMFVLILPY
jgi:hypothetical protein